MSAAIGSLKPVGMPKGMDPRTWRRAVAQRVNELLDQTAALIAALDRMETDCDLEDGADAEPWLGWGERGPQTITPVFNDGRGSPHDDREIEDEHGGDILDEPHDGDEREGDHAELDFPGFIRGGQGL